MTLPAVPHLLEGRCVIDRTWILLGPGATRLLASMGAEVIRIELTNPSRAGIARYVPPFMQDVPGPPDEPYGMDDAVMAAPEYRTRRRGKTYLRGNVPPRCCDD